MSVFYGKNLIIEVFGASHAEEIGVKVTGLPKGLELDYDELLAFMKRRSPGLDPLCSARHEADIPIFLSGVSEGKTNGDALCAVIKNTDVKKSDYVNLNHVPRPGHADLCAWQKYGLQYDMSGGSVFSGRMTAPICIIGGIILRELERQDISVSAEVCSAHRGIDIRDEAELRKADGDSAGGLVRCRVEGLPIGLGGELFSGLDAEIAALIYSIPGVKGLEFGVGFEAAKLSGSENNDEYSVQDGKIVFLSNNCGGVLGGMSTGTPLEFTVAFKPTPSIAKQQRSVDLSTIKEVTLSISGRHDPCYALRTPPIVESAAAIAIYDIMLTSSEKGLAGLRNKIDSIDGRLMELLYERLSVCADIADFKAANSLPVYDAAREAEKLSSVPDELRSIFGEIIKTSRQFQEEMLDG